MANKRNPRRALVVAPPPFITADEMVKMLRLLQHPDGKAVVA
jgi:hypothetical protein